MQGLFARLLYPVTGSESSMAATGAVVRLARQHRSSLTVIFVADTSVRDLLARHTRRPPEVVQRELEDKGRRYLNHVATLAARDGVPVVKVLRVGLTYSEIMAEAAAREVTLIVVGRAADHELRGLSESRLVRQIVENGPYSVLVLGVGE
jgi:nucleotide-binding universal stress UspA family protein